MKGNSPTFWCLWVGQSLPKPSSWINRRMLFRWVVGRFDNVLSCWLIAPKQLVCQVDHGPVESKRYFVTAALCDEDESMEFKEVSESKIIALGLKKSNSFKNFKSRSENRFYEVNLYMENP